MIPHKIYDPHQELLDSLPPMGRVRRHIERLRVLKKRAAEMKAEGVVIRKAGPFEERLSDTNKEIQILEEELREELKDRFHLLQDAGIAA